MNNVLEWMKSNLLIVIFCVVIIAAVVVLPLMAKGMNAEVKATIDANARKADDLDRISNKTHTVSLPGVNLRLKAPVNEATIREIEKLASETKTDADAVVNLAVERNRKGRGVLQPDLFPVPNEAIRNLLPQRFHDRLMSAYQSLLIDEQGNRAGMPPAAETMLEELRRAAKIFRETKLNVGEEDTLTAEDAERLQDHLTEYRVSMYRDAALELKLYASVDALNPPVFQIEPSMVEMFNWQWRYWITEDIVRAIQTANADAESVLEAPVKLIRDIRCNNPVVPGAGNQSAGPPAGMVGRGRAAAPPPSMAGAPGQIRPDYNASFITGRTTNPLYDVCNVGVILVVETARIPEVLDAISRYNFMTVTDIALEAAEPYEYVSEGFIFGNEKISRIDLQIETIWLRQWTTPLMPDEVKAALNIPIATDQGATADVG